jgi:hypothetical protein
MNWNVTRIPFLALLTLMLALPSFGQNSQSTVPPDVPATQANAEFPLHVRIFGSHWNHVRGIYEGFGHADLLGDQVRGFDYTFSCMQPFLRNELEGEYYQARWKKSGQKMELLTQQVGGNHLHRCELRVTLKAVPYGKYPAPPPGVTGAL